MSTHRYIGLTLIEMIIALSISVLIFALLVKFLLIIDHNRAIQKALIDIQEKSNHLREVFTQEIKKAGHIGCATLNHSFPLTSLNYYRLSANNFLTGNNHSLYISYVDFPNVILLRQKNENSLLVSAEIHFKVKDVLVVSDCNKGEMIQVERIKLNKSVQTIFTHQPIKNHFEKFAEVGKLRIHHFYIAKSQRKVADNQSDHALFFEDIDHKKFELLDQIDSLDFVYTVKVKNHFINQTASAIHDWSKVVGIAISYQLTSGFMHKRRFLYVSLQK